MDSNLALSCKVEELHILYLSNSTETILPGKHKEFRILGGDWGGVTVRKGHTHGLNFGDVLLFKLGGGHWCPMYAIYILCMYKIDYQKFLLCSYGLCCLYALVHVPFPFWIFFPTPVHLVKPHSFHPKVNERVRLSQWLQEQASKK